MSVLTVGPFLSGTAVDLWKNQLKSNKYSFNDQ